MSLDTTAPTRMNLLARRAQIKLAADGAGLLKGKREALLKELLARARELKGLRHVLHRRGRVSVATLAMARAVQGTHEVESAAIASRRELSVDVHFQKVWGLELSEVEHSDIARRHQDRGLGLLDCSSHVLDAAQTAELMLEQLVKCAPVEKNIQILGQEVRKVSRRINALEDYLLPRLRRDVRVIKRVLDEREREDIFRLKRIKKRKAAAAEARRRSA